MNLEQYSAGTGLLPMVYMQRVEREEMRQGLACDSGTNGGVGDGLLEAGGGEGMEVKETAWMV